MNSGDIGDMRRSFRSSRSVRVFTTRGSAFFLTCASSSREIVAVFFAELAVDRAQLLLEVELALILEHCAANVVIDLPLEAQQLDLAGEQLAEQIEQILSVPASSSDCRSSNFTATCAAMPNACRSSESVL